jgi:hypothetical protein
MTCQLARDAPECLGYSSISIPDEWELANLQKAPFKIDASRITHTCPEQLQHAGYTVERREELADIDASAAPMGSGCTCGDRTFPVSRHQIVECLLTKSNRNRAWIKRSERGE